MIYSQTGYCVCGQEIWIEYLWTGAEWRPRFSADELDEVAACPQCGRELDIEELDSL